jgi:hypothetical protein
LGDPLLSPGPSWDAAAEEGTRIVDVADGVSWTLMVAEAAKPVPWTRPEDIPHDAGRPLPRLGGQSADGAHVAFADGSERFLSRGVAPDSLRALVTRGDGELITFDKPGFWRRPGPERR